MQIISVLKVFIMGDIESLGQEMKSEYNPILFHVYMCKCVFVQNSQELKI